MHKGAEGQRRTGTRRGPRASERGGIPYRMTYSFCAHAAVDRGQGASGWPPFVTSTDRQQCERGGLKGQLRAHPVLTRGSLVPTSLSMKSTGMDLRAGGRPAAAGPLGTSERSQSEQAVCKPRKQHIALRSPNQNLESKLGVPKSLVPHLVQPALPTV